MNKDFKYLDKRIRNRPESILSSCVTLAVIVIIIVISYSVFYIVGV